LRGRAGERVSPQSRIPKRRKPSPAALFERVDLSRKRER
jgi:hypothetical protein